MDEPWLDADQQRVWRQWLDVTARLPVAMHRQLQATSELSLPDFDVLVQLSEHPEGRLRVSALADALQWERSRLSHHLGRMERRALIAREECKDDGRGAWVLLADAGRTSIERAAPDHARLVREVMFEGLSAAQLRDFGAVIETVAGRLREPKER